LRTACNDAMHRGQLNRRNRSFVAVMSVIYTVGRVANLPYDPALPMATR